MRTPALLPVLALATASLSLAATGCQESEPLHEMPGTVTVKAPIVGGNANTDLDAVMAMMVDTGGGLQTVCSGTMIAKNGSTGYVLTAAHCGSIDAVLEADTYSACQNGGNCRLYQVAQSQIHPEYASDQRFDFQLLRVTGVDGATPVIPAASNDQLSNGNLITLAGYGNMNSGGGLTDSPGRRSTENNIDAGFDFIAMAYSQSWNGNGTNGGVCFGDSGGFTGKMIGGQMQLIGVNQAVTDNQCNDFGISGRVQAVYGDFIAPFIGAEVPPLTCDQCFDFNINSPTGDCNGDVQACFSNQACSDLVECINGCSTNACRSQCATDHAGGVALYNAIFDCGCVACADECSAECNPGSSSALVTTGSGPATATATTGAGAGEPTGPGATTGAGDTTAGAGGAGGSESGSGSGKGSASGSGGDDSGSDKATTDDGCAIRAAGAPASGAAWLVAAGMALVASRRRRG